MQIPNNFLTQCWPRRYILLWVHGAFLRPNALSHIVLGGPEMQFRTIRYAFIAALCAVCTFAANASTILDFKPTPVSPTTPEFQFSRALGGGLPVFRGALGATSNNDGNLPIQNQTAPGLDVETPFILAGPGALNDLIAGTTHFFDSSIQFTAGLQANAPAIFAGGAFTQSLSPGSFQILSTGPAPILLLGGNDTAASFIAGAGNAGATFASQDVTYTGGIIFNAMIANGLNVTGNSFSISMTDVTPNFGINSNDGFLNDFTANATGLFSVGVVPEPATMCSLILPGIALLRRKRN
jgi:hypothetical protein